MERGREGRRGVAGTGPVSAPRRPRTSGFKDNSVGDDGEDVIDDVHNPRLRERPKKDGMSSAVQVMPSGSSGSTSRNKRKRQGSQELQGQARSSIVDELDETTEDTEVGVSEDDDDPPPPPIPRRPGKLRLQGKFLDDGIPTDLPTVPRKARTAILKRPQESPSPPVGDSSLQGLAVIPKCPASVNAVSSSPLVHMKPGRRMKSSALKLRAVKAPKVSTPTAISEQEVEVAEALFDLARMLTNQSNSSKLDVIIDMNPEPRAQSNPKVEPEGKLELDESANNIVACSQFTYPSSRTLSTSTAVASPIVSPQSSPVAPVTSPTALLPCVISSVVVPGGGTLPGPDTTRTPALPVTAPPAEAPKRKRPRLRTRPDLMGCVSEVGMPASSGGVSNVCKLSASSPWQEAEQMFTSCSPNTDGSSVKVEAVLMPRMATSTLVSTIPSSMLSSEPHGMGLSSRGVPGRVLLDKKSIAAEEVMKVEVLSTSQGDGQLAPVGIDSPSVTLTLEMDQAADRMPENQLLNFDLDGRSTQQPSSSEDQTPTAPIVTKSAVSSESERTPEVSGNTAEDRLGKCTVTVQVGSSGQPSWTDREAGRYGESRAEHEIQWEERKKYEKELESEKDKDSRIYRGDSEDGELSRQRDASKEKDREEEHGREELRQQLPQQRQGKAQRLDTRAQKMEKTASATTSSSAVSSFLASAPLIASSIATGVSSCPVTSAPIPSWPVGLPPMGYYSSGAADAVWPSGAILGGGACVDDNTPPGVQLPNPYTVPTRQPQPWKRCASHVYIAHFIDLQQQMNRHPFMHTAYHNAGSLFGSKPYNLNIPLPPAEAMFGNGPGGPLLGCVSGVTEVSVIAGDGVVSALGVLPGNEGNLGVASVITGALSKGTACGEALCKKQQQQPQQPSPNLASQSGSGSGFPVTQAGTSGVGGLVAAAPAAFGGSSANPGSVGGSAPMGGNSVSVTGLNTTTGPGVSNGGVVSHAVAQAQYLQAVMQQGGFPFPFQAAAQFGPSFNGPPGHMGPQQTAQFFGSPFYTTHLVHPPGHPQQQVQLGANGSGGLPAVQKQQQHSLQQVGRGIPPGSHQQQQQSTLVPVTHSPSHSQQQHTHSTASQQIQHLTEREGGNLGDNNSSSESKFSLLQRNVYGQGNPHVTVSAVIPPSSLVLGGGPQTVAPQDFSLLSALGAKQQQGPLASQQQPPLQQQSQAAVQHHVSGPALHTSFKGIDQQSSQTFSALSISSINRGAAVGPGPLGLAPVAAVMAPQGHAMLQSVADASRGQTQHQQPVTAQSHQHSVQSGQQHHAVQIQKTASPSISIEDGRALVDGNTFCSRTGREAAEDRKLPTKRGMSSSNLTRVDIDNAATIQAVSTGTGHVHTRITGSGVPTLNLMTPAPAIILSRPVGHPPGSGLQQPCATHSGNQNSKQAPPRGKLVAGLGGGASVPSTQSQLSFADRPSLGPLVPSKSQGTPLSSSGQNTPQSTQTPRQGQIPQHPQLKLSNRSSLGSLPTPSGTAPQAVLAAAIAKSQQVPQQQQSRSQAQVGTNTGPSTRLSSTNCGGTPTSTSIPLPPLPPSSKSAPTSSSKINLTSKNSFSLPHKPSSGVSGKRTNSANVSHVTSILGPTPLVQNLPLKSFQNHHSQLPSQQPPQIMSQYQAQPNLQQQSTQQHPSQPQSLISTQYHQQAHLQQVHNKQVLIQQQQAHQIQRVFLHSPAFQPLQQSSGSTLQQSSHQVVHQTAPSSQSQQRASSPQQQSQQQQPSQQQQHSLQGGLGSSPGTTSNGSLSLGPTLTLGTGSNGNISSAQPQGSDSLAASEGPGSRSHSTVNKMSGSGALQSSSRSNTDGNCQEQLNGIRGLSSSSSSSSLMPQLPHSSSPGRQPSSTRPLTAGNLVGKSLGVQFAGSNYSEDSSTTQRTCSEELQGA